MNKLFEIILRNILCKLHSLLVVFEQKDGRECVDSKSAVLQVGPMLNAVDALDGKALFRIGTQRLGALFAPMASRHVDPEQCGFLDAQALDVLDIDYILDRVKGHLFIPSTQCH